MRLTKEDKMMFEELSKSYLGAWLVEYSERLSDYAYDVRSWGEKTSRESAEQASKLITTLLRDKIAKRQDVKKFNAEEIRKVRNQHL